MPFETYCKWRGIQAWSSSVANSRSSGTVRPRLHGKHWTPWDRSKDPDIVPNQDLAPFNKPDAQAPERANDGRPCRQRGNITGKNLADRLLSTSAMRGSWTGRTHARPRLAHCLQPAEQKRLAVEEDALLQSKSRPGFTVVSRHEQA
jgi:hypothetical protein